MSRLNTDTLKDIISQVGLLQAVHDIPASELPPGTSLPGLVHYWKKAKALFGSVADYDDSDSTQARGLFAKDFRLLGSSGQPLSWSSGPTLEKRFELSVSGKYQWTASGSGTDEFYLEADGGGDPGLSGKPAKFLEAGTEVTEGSAPGSLSADEWSYGDNDSLGFSTIYYRHTSGSDPDGSSPQATFSEANQPTFTTDDTLYMEAGVSDPDSGSVTITVVWDDGGTETGTSNSNSYSSAGTYYVWTYAVSDANEKVLAKFLDKVVVSAP
jgi:hypothetical protein